jgi:hypothetical protein
MGAKLGLSLRWRNIDRVFENRHEREEDGSWRKLQNDELLSPYSSLSIVSVIK